MFEICPRFPKPVIHSAELAELCERAKREPDVRCVELANPLVVAQREAMVSRMLLAGRGSRVGCFPHGYADGEWRPTTSAPSYTFSDLPPVLTSTRLSSEAYGICRRDLRCMLTRSRAPHKPPCACPARAWQRTCTFRTRAMPAHKTLATRRWRKPVPHAGAACRCRTAWSHAMRCADGRDGAKLRREAVNSNAEPMAPLPPGGDA